MQLSMVLAAFMLLASSKVNAGSWGFEDATVSVAGRKAGVGGSKEKLAQNTILANPIELGPADNLKVLLTAKDGDKASRPHQTFLNLRDPKTGLETSYPFQVKDSGKGKLEISHKDIPTQLLSVDSLLSASLVIASFGYSTPYNSPAFELKIERDPAAPLPSSSKPLRYGKLPEIHHVFKSDPKSPPKIITVVFTAAVIFALPALIIAWASLGANVNHATKAFGNAPIPHTLFFFSVISMEAVFFMYYTSWNLFQTLPVATGVGLVTFLSGSRALREVQGRRLAGLR